MKRIMDEVVRAGMDGRHHSRQLVPAGADLFGTYRGLGVSHIEFKMCPADNGGVFVIENNFHAKGGPPRHLHDAQEEWFYILEGEFAFEIGDDKMRLRPGDSLLAPRKIPHVWAFDGEGRGRILIAFLPAGRMEAFFREVTKSNAMPSLDPDLWRAHGMEVVGPSLPVT